LAVLDGHARAVAAGLRRRASTEHLPANERLEADEAARYLVDKADHLDYPTALAVGWPIATGVSEGARRHLVKDRMDITGACWSAQGAEAVLQPRAVTPKPRPDQHRYHPVSPHAAEPGESRRSATDSVRGHEGKPSGGLVPVPGGGQEVVSSR